MSEYIDAVLRYQRAFGIDFGTYRRLNVLVGWFGCW
jgi:hypothetical protein